MKVNLKDKSLLGDNINRFVRKASNPESLRPMLKNSLSRQRNQMSLGLLSPCKNHQERTGRVKINSIERESRLNLTSRFQDLIQNSNTALTSRLFNNHQRDVFTKSKRERSMKNRFFEEDSEAIGMARARLLWRKQRRKSELDNKNKQKIKMLFQGPSTIGMKTHNNTSSFFHRPGFKPWETIRVNDRTLVLQCSRGGRQSSRFYRTIYN